MKPVIINILMGWAV